MSYKIIFHPIAGKEYYDSFVWYEKRLEGLGSRFEQAVEEKLTEIASSPHLSPKKKGNFREAKTASFPYVIVYKIYKQKKLVVILPFIIQAETLAKNTGNSENDCKVAEVHLFRANTCEDRLKFCVARVAIWSLIDGLKPVAS